MLHVARPLLLRYFLSDTSREQAGGFADVRRQARMLSRRHNVALRRVERKPIHLVFPLP